MVSETTRHEKNFFYGKLHAEKGLKSWLASNSEMDTCSLSCEVNRSPNTYTRSHLLSQSSETNRSLCVALPQQLALLCPCSGSFCPLQHYARSRCRHRSCWQAGGGSGSSVSPVHIYHLFGKGVRSLVIWLPMSRFRIPSGGILDYKLLFSPSSGKQACCSLLLLKQSQIQKSH